MSVRIITGDPTPRAQWPSGADACSNCRDEPQELFA